MAKEKERKNNSYFLHKDDVVKSTIYMPLWIRKKLEDYQERNLMSSLNDIYIKALVDLLEREKINEIRILKQHHRS